MIIPDMFSIMGIALDDLDRSLSPPSLLLTLLRQSEDRVISKLSRDVVRTLDTSATSQALNSTTGAFDLSGLSSAVWRKTQGIDAVWLTSGKNCRRVSYEEMKLYVQGGKASSVNDPMYYIRGTTIYVLPFSDQTIDIYYRREPATMELDVASGSIAEGVVYYVHNYTTLTYNSIGYVLGDTFTGVSAVTTYTVTGPATGLTPGYVCVNSELEDYLHNIIIGHALEPFITHSSAAKMKYQAAISEIKEINSNHIESDFVKTGKFTYAGSNPIRGSSRGFNILTG